ncbi:hypothetical protein NDU88_010551 [Pleurodeles waltl]|uniref:Uncharacterized protein n=1 Tax=Pleurodeles waltl TaxID=8319 RepID=A0AAV7QYK9_PLEWA|nr:hypothetical protein NDU88_010551 [Pleurodeles waltl]
MSNETLVDELELVAVSTALNGNIEGPVLSVQSTSIMCMYECPEYTYEVFELIRLQGPFEHAKLKDFRMRLQRNTSGHSECGCSGCPVH